MIAVLREMNGKYVGSRPVELKISNWQNEISTALEERSSNRSTLFERRDDNRSQLVHTVA